MTPDPLLSADREREALRAAADYDEMRKARGWPTPNHMRTAADALDSLTPARYGDVLRWFADLCDAALSSPETTPAGLDIERLTTALYRAGIRDASVATLARNVAVEYGPASPETTPAGVLPPITPIPGLEHMRSAMDVFTPEERADLFDQLERLARERRAGEFEAGKLRLP